MVQDAQPAKVEGIASHWMHVHDQLAGDAPDGSVQALLDKAVADVMEYWHGDAADSFAARAKDLSVSLKNGALYAKNTCHALQGAAVELREVQRAVMALQDTASEQKHGSYVDAMMSGVKDGANWLSDLGVRDDSGLKRDVANGMSTSDALAKHQDTLSRGREIALQAAVHMERLGAAYTVRTGQLGTPPPIKEHGKVIPPPDTIVPPPVVVTSGTGAGSDPRQVGRPLLRNTGGHGASTSSYPSAPRSSGAPGGGGRDPIHANGPTATPKVPTPGTALDGVRGGLPTPVTPASPGPAGEISGGVPGGGSGPGTLTPGVPGAFPGRGRVGGGQPFPGSRSAYPGVPEGPKEGTGTRMPTGKVRGSEPEVPGRSGPANRLPLGPPGAPGASGVGRSPASAGKQGGLARRGGGVVGEPGRPGTPGRGGGQGGSGLHRSRGGALGGRTGANSAALGPGGVPPHGRTSREDDRRRGAKRPDYLVEDGETWLPLRELVPGVIGDVTPADSTSDGAVPEPPVQEPETGTAEGKSQA